MLAAGALFCLDPRYAPPMAESESLSTARLIDGRALGTVVRTSIAERIAAGNRPVRLDAILVGDDRSAELYAANRVEQQ